MFGADHWEITATCDASDLAIAVQAVSDAAIRADGDEKDADQFVADTAALVPARVIGS